MKYRYDKNGKPLRRSWTFTIKMKMQKELDKKFLDQINDVIVKGHIGNKQS